MTQQAGTHLIIDLYGVTQTLNDLAAIDYILIRIVEAIGATLIKTELHHFEPQGVTGVAILAESHISIHTWPEKEYAALDIFVCGSHDPNLALPVIKNIFQPQHIQCVEIKRGMEV